METTETVIASHPFLRGLGIEVLPMLARAATLQHYGVGELIFQERREADRLYLLQHGHVALEAFVPGRGTVVLQTLGPGEALGWSWLFPPHRWQFSARSVDATQIISFDAARLRELAEEHPDFGRELVTRMAQVLLARLQATRTKLEEFHYPGSQGRIDDCLTEPDEEGEPTRQPLR
ncbi:MAG: cyclic nucleotide-binding domain-containing protein [Verrucomicrobiota bacterium]|jgi:CRP-like cAMP-binding protein